MLAPTPVRTQVLPQQPPLSKLLPKYSHSNKLKYSRRSGRIGRQCSVQHDQASKHVCLFSAEITTGTFIERNNKAKVAVSNKEAESITRNITGVMHNIVCPGACVWLANCH
jgi:hypothetical protein